LALVPLPRRDHLRATAQPLREGSLRQAPVHPALADPLPERPRLVRVIPWEPARSRPAEPEAGKRQRNGGRVATSGTSSAAASGSWCASSSRRHRRRTRPGRAVEGPLGRAIPSPSAGPKREGRTTRTSPRSSPSPGGARILALLGRRGVRAREARHPVRR
jgi:hypothetical protein